MPQDIPLEAGDTLVFTPPSLADIDGAPSFTLRAVTMRDKRFHRRLYLEQGVMLHNTEAVRAAVIDGLKALWTEEQVGEHLPIVTSYWEAIDNHQLQAKDDPDLPFDYDAETVAAIDALVRNVSQEWAPLRRMIADNQNFSEMSPLLLVSTMVKSFTGLDVPRRLDRGYLEVDCAEAVMDALDEFERRHQKTYGIEPGAAWVELYTTCGARLVLDREEAKNFASPSPSETTPPASSPTGTSEQAGKSPASARSKKTRGTA